MLYIILIIIVVLAYFWGSASTARIVAKSVRSLNIYKVGSGLADTENIYTNVSKPLGILVGALDAAKSYAFLLAVETLFRILHQHTQMNFAHYTQDTVLIGYGMIMLIGHCLPVTQHFKGGRGIFTYMGFIAYISFYPMVVTAFIAMLLVYFYRQIRFAQYLIVLLPVILSQILYSYIPYFKKGLSPHFLSMMFASIVLMGILNFIVSKKLGEI